jgi:4-alpha-glucanotransferase
VASDTREPRTGEILRALWANLKAGPAEVVLANLEDVWLESGSQNVPGTTTERGNWRRKHRFAMEQWDRLPNMRLALASLKRRSNKEKNHLP